MDERNWLMATVYECVTFLICVSLIASAQAQPQPPLESLQRGTQPDYEKSRDASLETPESFPRFPPVEPNQTASSFVVQDGFTMQLIAAEPLITDPVAMTIDEDGRAYVVEMNDYPYTDRATHKAWQENTTDAPIGRVRLLEDLDGDGVYDRSTVFAEELSWPSGILSYRGGVFVTATPDIWYLKDTDGDRKADVRELVFTGFRKYNVQAVMNNPVWGVDNWIYVAGSSNGGSVLAPGKQQAAPIVARGDFRIDPRTRSFERQAGGARFGNAFDDWGNRFLCNIRNPAIHVVLDDRYLARNPFYAAPTAVVNIAESGDQMPIFRISPVEPWRDLRGRQWSADPTKKVPRSELTGGGVFTSTSGINVYRGDAYPDEYKGQMFVAEVANNVIYRQRVAADGNTFRATRADEGVEFVASTDTWFRPVNIYNAPDGTLYVLDMYREFIEHPWSIPDDIHARLDLTSGRDRGRIYRLAPPNFKVPAAPRLGSATTEQLVLALTRETSWWRETAQRLLVERQDKSAEAGLREVLQSDQPQAALHALWTLAGIDGLLKPDYIRAALKHASPRVRQHAVRIAELIWHDENGLLEATAELAGDEDNRVRLQVALSLGDSRRTAALEALGKIAARDCEDPWVQAALCSARPDCIAPFLQTLLVNDEFITRPGAAKLVEQLAQILASANKPQGAAAALSSVMQKSNDSPIGNENLVVMQDALWIGLGNGVLKKGKSLNEFFAAAKEFGADVILETTNEHVLSNRLGRDELIAASAASSESHAVAATLRLTLAPIELAAPRLANLIEPSQRQVIQITALRCLAVDTESLVASVVIPKLRTMSPSVREEALTLLMARPDRSLALLDAISRGEVPSNVLGLARKTQLLASSNSNVKRLAEEVLGKVEASRTSVVERYSAAIAGAGDAARGRQIFVQHCAACHRAGELGVDIGPHMETVRAWERSKILLNILDPNREVAPQSMAYAIALSSGNVISGMIAEETASSLTVKRAGVPPETILRQEIEQMTNTGQSLMPTGFEESISPAAMADLLSFLQSK